MKRFAFIASLLVLITMLALPAVAAPAAFDFADGNPLPDATTLDAELTGPVEFTVTNPFVAAQEAEDTVTWYIWPDSETSPTPANAADELPLVYDTGSDQWSGSLPAATVNALDNGTYNWDIIAVDATDSAPQSITGGPFSFTLDLPAEATFDFVGMNPLPDGGTVIAEPTDDVTFEVTNPFDVADPAAAGTVTWYLWAGATPGMVADAADNIPFTYDAGTMTWSGTLAATTFNGLADGTYSWTIIADDTTTQSEVAGAPFTFTVDLIPDVVNFTPVVPTSGATLTTPLEGILFTVTEDVVWIELYVYNPTTEALPVSGFVNVDEVCADNDVCAVLDSTANLTFGYVPNGDYQLFYRLFQGEEDDFAIVGANDEYQSFDFSVEVPATTAPTNTFPMDMGTYTTVTEFVWPDVPAATYYSLSVTGPNTQIDVAGFARDVCQGSLCTVELDSSTLLLNGDYTATFGVFGPGDTDLNTTTVNFTIEAAVPTPPQLTNPAPNSTVPVPGLTDLTFPVEQNTLWYRIYIVNPTAGVYTAEWVYQGEICDESLCTYEASLEDGDYNVWIAGYGPEGVVSPFTATFFTVNSAAAS